MLGDDLVPAAGPAEAARDSQFGNGAEKTRSAIWRTTDGTLVKAVENQEQWRSFLRWISPSGLARNVDVPGHQGGRRRRVDRDRRPVLGTCRPTERAEDWLAELRRHLPIFGSSCVAGRVADSASRLGRHPAGGVVGTAQVGEGAACSRWSRRTTAAASSRSAWAAARARSASSR